jgi:hypothetical protein
MHRFRTCAGIAAWLLIALLLSACSLLEQILPPPPPAPQPLFQPVPPPPESPAPQSTAPPSRDEARADMAQWLAGHGYKDFQVSALLAHARAESNFNVCIRGAGDLSYTFQWGGTRLRQLHQFAHTDGCPHLHAQLAFADWELHKEPKFACFWNATSEAGAYAALRRGFGRGSC